MFKLTGQLKKVLIATLLVLAAAAVIALQTGIGTYKTDDAKIQKYQTARPTQWATPIEKNGLSNFHKVSDCLYRGAQPGAEGIKQLKDMGIKTIINLRSFNSDTDEIGGTEIGYERIYMKTWYPEDEDVVKFLKIVTDKTKTPVFVHCRYGSDRTGLMCAIYRVAVCGWTKEAAADEMVYGGYGFHPMWKNLINYFMNLDVEKIKQQAGLQNTNPQNEVN
jgi:protein tyrosine/serine phosphatase